MLKVTPNLMTQPVMVAISDSVCADWLQGGAPRFVYEIKWKGARARHLCADMQYCGKPANQAPPSERFVLETVALGP